MNRLSIAMAVCVMAGAGAAQGQLVTNDPYVMGAGRTYHTTGPGTNFPGVPSFFDVFTELNMLGPPIAPPPDGGTLTASISAAATLDVDGNGSADALTDGLMVIRYLFGLRGPSLVTFDTEMLSMDLQGGTLPPGVWIRESPTLQSLGQTSITDLGGGQFRIDSFFDVFTELSLDGGQTWLPSTGPTHLEILPTPSAAALLGLGGLMAGRRRRA